MTVNWILWVHEDLEDQLEFVGFSIFDPKASPSSRSRGPVWEESMVLHEFSGSSESWRAPS